MQWVLRRRWWGRNSRVLEVALVLWGWVGWEIFENSFFTCELLLLRKPSLILDNLFNHSIVHLKLAYGWWREPIPSLGIAFEFAGTDSVHEFNHDGWYDWGFVSTLELPVVEDPKTEAEGLTP
jgi:hypothetical protein